MDPHPGGSEEALVVVRNRRGDEATLSLHGAQLLSWAPAGAGEQLYRSPLSRPGEGKSVRGGVPVCFPQFSDRGPLPKHGIVRTSHWELVFPPVPGAEVGEARFQIDSSMASTPWEHAFCLVLVVRLGPGWIELHLQAANTGRTGYDFTAALHTYLGVGDVRTAQLHGVQRCAYEDNLAARQVKQEGAEPLEFGGETDRVYLQVPPSLYLHGGGSAARAVVQQGFTDTVVWNPGPRKAAKLGDLPPGDWQRMVCIEAASAARPVHLEPGKTWRGMQRLEVPGAAHYDPALATPVHGA